MRSDVRRNSQQLSSVTLDCWRIQKKRSDACWWRGDILFLVSHLLRIKLPSTKISLACLFMMFCKIELYIHSDELIQFDKSWGIMDTFLGHIIHEDEWRQVICNICNISNQLSLTPLAHIASVKSSPCPQAVQAVSPVTRVSCVTWGWCQCQPPPWSPPGTALWESKQKFLA